MANLKGMLPLTEAFYYILIALYAQPRMGTASWREVEGMSGGRVKLGAGTLYTALNTLLGKGLIDHIRVRKARMRGARCTAYAGRQGHGRIPR